MLNTALSQIDDAFYPECLDFYKTISKLKRTDVSLGSHLRIFRKKSDYLLRQSLSAFHNSIFN